ncbi:hypothetical protein DM02DRAFT_725960 [Periconia macrospinosa]|uniref:Uncharacterized protein n=1 Tax=Periconia macrospinosa TaxID=97972 RepID=A0A2V1E4S7_9PLEO|nr:hypothetical protein DM02DRAFT_725960 [Periconia macrospinosa]
MRGKNKGKGLKKVRKPQPIAGPPNVSASFAEKSIASTSASELGIPRLVCSEIATIVFADTAEPSIVADILAFIPMVSRAMYQLYDCIKIDTVGMDQSWFTPLFTDPASFNCACMVVQSYFDEFLGRTRSREAQRADQIRYAKTINTLQARIASEDDNIRLSESTIMTVLGMLGHAYTSRDIETSNRHNSGLLQLVSMRGIESLLHNTRLCVELIRCDLYHAIDNGSTPMLLNPNNILWELPSSVNPKSQTLQLKFYVKLHPELAAIWAAMFEFCTHINAAYRDKRLSITEEQFLQNMTSIMYRLVYLHFPLGSLDEAVRIGLIAFSSPVFLHWNRVELPDRQFNFKYRDSLITLDLEVAEVEPQEIMWLLMAAAISMAHEEDNLAWLIPWLNTTFQDCGIQTWDELKTSLDEVLWVGIVHDEVGKALFTTASEWTTCEEPPALVRTM